MSHVSRILAVGLAIVWLALGTSSPVGAAMIANGDFESTTAGEFDGWTYADLDGNPTSNQVAAVSTAPEVIGGITSARLLRSGTGQHGFLTQAINGTEFPHFTVDLDFAVLSFTNTGWDTLGVGGFDGSGSGVFAIDVAHDGSLRYHTSAGWVDTGLDVSATTDINNDGAFDDGETPMVNHLQVSGTNFGLANPEVTFTLTGGTIDGSFTADGSSGHRLPTGDASNGFVGVQFYGTYREVDFLVDNVVVSAVVPEPSSACVFALGLLGLIGGAWRRRRR